MNTSPLPCPIRGHDHDTNLLWSVPARPLYAPATYNECPTGMYRFLMIEGNEAPIKYKRPRWGWRKES